MKANSYGDLGMIKLSVLTLSQPDQRYFLSRVYAHELMKVGWFISFGVRMINWRIKHVPSAWLALIYHEKTGMLERGMMESFADHLTDGVDLYEDDSKGGFWQAEINLIWAMVQVTQELDAFLKKGEAK